MWGCLHVSVPLKITIIDLFDGAINFKRGREFDTDSIFDSSETNADF